MLGGVAGGKLYDVLFVSSSTALRLLRSRLGRLARRLSRAAAADTAAPARSDDAEQWSTTTREMSREDGAGTWRENSLYRLRSESVDARRFVFRPRRSTTSM